MPPPANAAAFAHAPALAGVLARASPGVLARAGPAFPGGGAWPGAAGVGDHATAQGLRGRSGPAIPRGMRMRRGHSADHVAPLCRAPRVLVSWVLPLLLVVQPLAAPEPALGQTSAASALRSDPGERAAGFLDLSLPGARGGAQTDLGSKIAQQDTRTEEAKSEAEKKKEETRAEAERRKEVDKKKKEADKKKAEKRSDIMERVSSPLLPDKGHHMHMHTRVLRYVCVHK